MTVLKSLTAVIVDSFPNFTMARKEASVHYSSLMDIVAKAEMSLKRQ